VVAKRIVFDRDETPRGERDSGAAFAPHLTGLLGSTRGSWASIAVLRIGMDLVVHGSEGAQATQIGPIRFNHAMRRFAFRFCWVFGRLTAAIRPWPKLCHENKRCSALFQKSVDPPPEIA
jgi:hypothetical protein